MKILKNISTVIFILSFFQYNTIAQLNFEKIKPEASFIMSVPIQGAEKNVTDKNLFGYNIGFLTSFQNTQFLELGIQYEQLYNGKQENEWIKDITLKTKSKFWRINFVSRIRPFKNQRISPYIELAYGLNVSSIKSKTYELTEEGDFVAWLFAEEEEEEDIRAFDKYAKEKVNYYRDGSQNIVIGLGFDFDEILNFSVKYNYCPEVRFVNMSDVNVSEQQVTYEKIDIGNMHMLTFNIGISIPLYVD